MRDFFRLILRIFMILFLVVGCVQNVYYFGELTKNTSNPHRKYGGYGYYGNRNTTEKEYEDKQTTSDTDGYDDVPYPEYNRHVSAVRPY